MKVSWYLLIRRLPGVTMCCLFVLAAISQTLTAQQWVSRGPIGRDSSTAVLNPTNNRMVVFGGATTFSSPVNPNLNDVWRLNTAASTSAGLAWTFVRPTGAPPAPRVGHTSVYDTTDDRMVVFGGAEGRASPCANDVWVLENTSGAGGSASWIQLSPSGGAPFPRYLHASVYDATTNSMITFGGLDCFSTFFNDVWVLSNANGLGGTPTWTQLSPTGTPPAARDTATAVYDATNNLMIVFGGDGNGTIFGDVWVLSNANGSGGTPTWSQLSPSGTGPAPRANHTAVYDSTNNRMTIFGGSTTGGVIFGDAWVRSNANGLGGTPTWAQIGASSTRFPAPRYDHTAFYNAASNLMTIFGGLVNSAETLDTNDVFVLTHANGL